MQKITVIAMGKLTNAAFRSAAEDYLRRMSKSYSVTVTELKPEPLSQNPSAGEIGKALEREAGRILEAIPQKSAVVAMCVEGRDMSSPDMAAWIEKSAQTSPELCFIIGSSFGLHESVKNRANLRLSFSKMTFPHELFRVMLYEQIYRCAEIIAGSRYHK